MCGINGFNWKDEKLILEMNKSIEHRGPDDTGAYFDENMSMGQVRLSILDLSEKGHQPLGLKIKNDLDSSLIFQDRELKNADIIIVFNGEIYNFQELKKQLSESRFESDTDTEVILKAYYKWGFDCVNYFNGMWAFCIYDKIKNILFCSRDRFGKKPFYYYEMGPKFIFSSELKGILSHVQLGLNKKSNLNVDSFNLYFAMGYIPAPYTIWNNAYKLEASHNLIYSISEKKILKKWLYYELPNYNPMKAKQALMEELNNVFLDSIRLRLRADVPLGVFLSGGLDSSTIVANLSKLIKLENLNTFSIGFEGQYDESPYIDIVQKKYKTQHHHEYFTEKSFLDNIERYSFAYDEPFGDYSGFPTIVLSELTQKYVKVALGGDGGDEIFGGYSMYQYGTLLDRVYKIPKFIRKLLSKLPNINFKNNKIKNAYQRFKSGIQGTLYDKSDYLVGYFGNLNYCPAIFQNWIREKFSIALEKGNHQFGEAFRIFDILYGTFGDHYLVKTDRASMQFGLEIRAPFLDYRLIELSQKIPTKWKQSFSKTKIMMRKLIRDLLPVEILTRKKQGFTPPIEEWIMKDELANDLTISMNLISEISEDLHKYFKEIIFAQQSSNYAKYVIRLFLFYHWAKKWMIND